VDFVEFYQATSPRTLRYAYGLTGDLPQAQDVVQEAYARAWQRWRKVGGYDDAEAWLRLVVTRLVFDWWRQLGVRRRAAVETVAAVPPPSEDAVLLTTALRTLPEAQRRALVLHYLLDLPIAQIAAETGVAEGTVKSWLSRGRVGLAEALRDEADNAKLPPAEAAADRGRRRRRTRAAVAATAAGLAVLAVIVLATALLRQGREQAPPPQPVAPTASPLAFQRLQQVGGVAVPMPQNVTYGMSAIVDGRGFVGWHQEDGLLKVGGIDLATGKQLWPVRALPGAFGDWIGLLAVPNAIVSIGEHDDGISPDKTMFVLDPATGRLRWQRGMDVNGSDILFYRDVVVLADHAARTTIALDWVTGKERWKISGSIAATLGMQHAADMVGSAGARQGPFSALLTGDSLLHLDPSGTLTEYAVATGAPTGRSWRDVPVGESNSVSYLAYEGSLYITDGPQLSRLTLTGGGLVPLYSAQVPVTSAENRIRMHDVIPCGHGELCLLDGDLPHTDLVVLAGDRVVRRQRANGAESLLPIGDAVLVRGFAQDGPWNALYDSTGRQVLDAADQHALLTRVDPANLLSFTVTSGAAMGRMIRGELFGVDVMTGSRVDLGPLTTGPIGMGVQGTLLVCATPAGFVVYRIA
jgi:RNA polymerase sigma-70 factor (sigma-E family)